MALWMKVKENLFESSSALEKRILSRNSEMWGIFQRLKRVVKLLLGEADLNMTALRRSSGMWMLPVPTVQKHAGSLIRVSKSDLALGLCLSCDQTTTNQALFFSFLYFSLAPLGLQAGWWAAAGNDGRARWHTLFWVRVSVNRCQIPFNALWIKALFKCCQLPLSQSQQCSRVVDKSGMNWRQRD